MADIYNPSYFRSGDWENHSSRLFQAKSAKPFLKYKTKKDWRCGSSGRAPA
jgi:hypothetical protein